MYLDAVPMATLPYSTATGLTTPSGYLSLADKIGNALPIKQLPIERFDISKNGGSRIPLMRALSLSNCYYECTDASEIGKVLVLVFWYQQPYYASADKTANTLTDSVEVPITVVGQKNLMPDLRALAGKRYRRISFVAPAITQALATGITLSEAENCYVSLYKGNYAICDLLPLPELYDLYLLEQIKLRNIQFDLNNSFIVVGGSVNLVGKSVFFNVSYEN